MLLYNSALYTIYLITWILTRKILTNYQNSSSSSKFSPVTILHSTVIWHVLCMYLYYNYIMWSAISLKTDLKIFCHKISQWCDYVCNHVCCRVLHPQHGVANLSLWTSYYCRFNLKVTLLLYAELIGVYL